MLNLPKQSKYTKHRPLFILAGIAAGGVFLGVVAILAVLAFGPVYMGMIEHSSFCGSLCHEMKPSYESYKNSAHHGVLCSECHSKPGVVGFVKGLVADPVREVYVHMSGEKAYNMDELNPKILNSSCLRSECHSIEKMDAGKKFMFADFKAFNHGAHLSGNPKSIKTPAILLPLNCTSCHSRSNEKHMDIDRHVCFLCHFTPDGSMSDIKSCDSCHAIPASQHEKIVADDSSCGECHHLLAADIIKAPEEKCARCHEDEVKSSNSDAIHKAHAITQNARCMDCHQPLKQGHGALMSHYGKKCRSCHDKSSEMHLIADQRSCFLCHSAMPEDKMVGLQKCTSCHNKAVPQHETVMLDEDSCKECHAVMASEASGTAVPQEKCLKCHKGEVELVDSDMAHQKHSELKGAQCMECHQALKQKHGGLFAHYSGDCQRCHSTQAEMYKGNVKFIAQSMPSPKAKKVNCNSCHVLVIEKGADSRSAIRQKCLGCHEAGYDQMLDDWQEMIRDELKEATGLLSNVDKMLKASKDAAQKQQASSLYNKAREQILFVQKDNSSGAHNVELTDQLLADAIDKLKKSQQLVK